jgi:hypothetical protein
LGVVLALLKLALLVFRLPLILADALPEQAFCCLLRAGQIPAPHAQTFFRLPKYRARV